MKTILVLVSTALVLGGCSRSAGVGLPATPLQAPAIGGSAAGAPDAQAVAGATLLTKTASPIKLSSASLVLLGTGNVSTRSVTVSEPGYSGKFTEKSTCQGIATAKPATGKGPSLKVKVTANGAGACAIAFLDSAGHKATLKVSDTTAAFALSASSISPKSTSATIALMSVNGHAPPSGIVASVTVKLKSCASGCTVRGPQSPPGTDRYTLTIFDAAGGKGHALATGIVSFKVVAAKSNTIAAALAKIVMFLTFGAVPSATAGSAFATPAPLPLTVQDADRDPISGSYSVPIKVSDGDTSPIAKGSSLSVNGGKASRSVRLTKSTDTLALGYGGLAIAPVTLSASAAGASGATAQFAPALSAISYAGPQYNGAPEIDLYDPTPSQPGYQASFALSQLGWSGGGFSHAFTYTLGGGSAGNNCSSFTVSPASGTSNTYTVALSASPATGSCPLTVTGVPSVASLAITLTYTTSGIGVNTKRPRKPH